MLVRLPRCAIAGIAIRRIVVTAPIAGRFFVNVWAVVAVERVPASAADTPTPLEATLAPIKILHEDHVVAAREHPTTIALPCEVTEAVFTHAFTIEFLNVPLDHFETVSALDRLDHDMSRLDRCRSLVRTV